MIPDISWTIAIMCFNELPTLNAVVAQTAEVLSSLDCDYEIIIIDDGSTDGSGQVADELANSVQRVRVIHHTANLGIGEVLYSAYSSAEKDWISIVPADGEFHPSDLLAGYTALDQGTVVCYSLTLLPHVGRRFVSACQRLLNLALFGLSVRRVNWVKILPAQEIRRFELTSRTPIIETEILVRLKKRGYRIIELPSQNEIRVRRTGGMSPVSYLQAVLASLPATFKLWRSTRRSHP
ncbi:MAG TPA: glycosyltransferase family 2 protein [Anaerolineales bacterium]|nr:glycosyltransferase family 2 protein [Anaerolineales bacterium]